MNEANDGPIRLLLINRDGNLSGSLQETLAGEPAVELIGEASWAGIRPALDSLRPQLILADFDASPRDIGSMLEQDGSDPVLLACGRASAESMLRAFDQGAIDYLAKPIRADRFAAAVQRARRHLADCRRSSVRANGNRVNGNQANGNHSEATGAHLAELSLPNRLVVKSRGRISLISVEEIAWIEAAGDYMRVHVGDRSYLVKATMQSLERRLDDSRFVRIHRSAIVDLARIRELRPLTGGDYRVILKDGTELTLSRSYRDALEPLLQEVV